MPIISERDEKCEKQQQRNTALAGLAANPCHNNWHLTWIYLNPSIHLSGLLEEAGLPGEKPQRCRANVQTAHRKAEGCNWTCDLLCMKWLCRSPPAPPWIYSTCVKGSISVDNQLVWTGELCLALGVWSTNFVTATPPPVNVLFNPLRTGSYWLWEISGQVQLHTHSLRRGGKSGRDSCWNPMGLVNLQASFLFSLA